MILDVLERRLKGCTKYVGALLTAHATFVMICLNDAFASKTRLLSVGDSCYMGELGRAVLFEW